MNTLVERLRADGRTWDQRVYDAREASSDIVRLNRLLCQYQETITELRAELARNLRTGPANATPADKDVGD